MRPSRKTSAAVSPLEGGTEPFPAVTEEETRDLRLGDASNQAHTYGAQDKGAIAGNETRQSVSMTDKTEDSAAREPLTGAGQVCTQFVLT
jgi:hypothetical protein